MTTVTFAVGISNCPINSTPNIETTQTENFHTQEIIHSWGEYHQQGWFLLLFPN